MITCRIVQGSQLEANMRPPSSCLWNQRRSDAEASGSLACLGATAGNLLGSATGAFLFHSLNENQIAVWGWRIPFLMGVGVAITGILSSPKVYG